MSKVVEMMFCYFSITCLIVTTLTSAQVAYSRVLPYDPRYLLRRVPVRRSVDMEPRIRLPIARYFPQVDNDILQAPYAVEEPTAYRLPNGELYAIPEKWQEEAIPITQLERNDDTDYDNYEYENEFSPVYAGTYPINDAYGVQPIQESEIQEPDSGDLYNDLMVNYLFNEMQPRQEMDDTMNIQRRSQETAQQSAQSEKVANETTTSVTVLLTSTVAPVSQESSSSAPVTASQVVASNASPVPEPSPKKTTVAIPQSFPTYGHRFPMMQQGVWHDLEQEGQKEMPLYRPIHAGQPKSSMLSLEEQLSRAKNSSPNKNAFPLLEKIMAAQRNKDPLTEQLDSLKLRSM